MKYDTTNNPLCTWYRSALRRARKKSTPVCDEWKTWLGFAKWCEDHGYDENSKLHYSAHNPFGPEYIGTTRYEERDYEYIAYDAQDPYELIIASAPYIEELSEKLKRLGYDYTYESIRSALSRNEERAVEDRIYGLIFEKVDLTDYNEDGEPFEERN